MEPILHPWVEFFCSPYGAQKASFGTLSIIFLIISNI